MLKRLRRPEPFGKAGLIVGIAAIVFAMLGGAYAASNNSGGKATASAKAKKGPRGPKGATGPAGPAGPQGPAGPKGDTGSAGAGGANGTSVTGAPASVGECPTGGVKYTSASGANAVCNGKNGTTGFTETLPSGKTEKGTWGAAGVPVKIGSIPFKGLESPISFVIPLATAPEPIIIGIEAGEGEEKEAEAIKKGECTGTVKAPGAAEGKLCIFVQGNQNLTSNLNTVLPAVAQDPASGVGGIANPAGTMVIALAQEGSEPLTVAGTWAVTAE